MIRLFPLSLEGKGTSEIESLPSYLLRLAYLHAVPVARLLDSLPYRQAVNSANKQLSGSLGSLVRPNSTTELVVAALGRACSEDAATLRAATLLSLDSALARSSSSFALHLRWCPLCLAEQMAKSDTCYLKLAWQCLGVRACVHHRVLLQDKCPSCGSAQRGWWRKAPLNICDRCGARLDGTLQGDTPSHPLAECAPDLLRLIQDLAANPLTVYLAGGSSIVVRTLIDSLKESGDCPDRLSHIELLEISRYAGGRRMSLPMARRIAFQLSISLPELLSGDVKGINHVFGFCLLNRLPGDLAPRMREHLAGEQEMYRAFVKIIERAESAPSLREVARRLGVSVGVLCYRFPRETEQVARAWRRRRQRAAKMRLGRVRSAVARCIDQWSSQHRGPLTKKGVLHFLRATTDLPKEPLRKEIDSALLAREVRHEISQRCVRLGICDPWHRSRKPPAESGLGSNESAEENFFRALAWVSRSTRRATSKPPALSSAPAGVVNSRRFVGERVQPTAGTASPADAPWE